MTAITSRATPSSVDERGRRSAIVAEARLPQTRRSGSRSGRGRATSSPGRSQRPSAGFTPSTDISSGRDARPREPHRLAVAGQREPVPFGVRGDVERPHRLAHLGEPAVRIRAGDADQARSDSGYGSGDSRMPSTRLKTAVLAPMPSASVSTATSGEPGLAPQHARAVSQVLPQRVEKRGAPRVAAPSSFAGPRAEAPLDASRRASSGRSTPLDVVRRPSSCTWYCDLVVELLLDRAPAHERSPAQRQRVEPVFESRIAAPSHAQRACQADDVGDRGRHAAPVGGFAFSSCRRPSRLSA